MEAIKKSPHSAQKNVAGKEHAGRWRGYMAEKTKKVFIPTAYLPSVQKPCNPLERFLMTFGCSFNEFFKQMRSLAFTVR